MAEVALDIKVNSGTSVNSVKDLKAQIKELESAALAAGNAGDEALARKYAAAAGEAKDQLADFKNEIKSVQDAGSKLGAIANVGATIASGFQAAQGAAALFGSAGEDVQKVLVKVQAATALAQGAQALANATEDIAIAKKVVFTTVTNIANAATKAFGLSAQAAMAAATAGITLVVGAIIGLIAYLNTAQDETEQLRKEEELLQKQREKAASDNRFYNDSEIASLQVQIDKLEALGGKEKEINLLRQDIVKKRLKNVQDIINAEDTTVEQQREALIEQTKLYGELEVLQIEATKSQKKVTASIKETAEVTKTITIGSIADYNNRISTLRDELDNLVIGSDKYIGTLKEIERLQNELAAKTKAPEPPKPTTPEKTPEQLLEEEFAAENELVAKQQAEKNSTAIQNAKEEEERILRNNAFKIQATQDALSTIQKLTEAFQGKSNASARRVFAINKAVSIAQATIDTALSAQKAYASQLIPGDPSSPIRATIAAGIALASGLARIAIIQKQKFEGGGGGASASGAGGGGGVGSVPAPTAPTVPTFNPQGTIIPQNNQQQQNTIKAYVLEDDISTSQNRITDIKTKALYG